MGGPTIFLCSFYILLTSSIPFQLSPVAILNNVSIAVPKSLKCACGPRPWQGCDGEHSETNDQIRQLTYMHTYIPMEFKLQIARDHSIKATELYFIVVIITVCILGLPYVRLSMN